MNEDNIYLDTSALLPYYREEPLSRLVEKLLNNTQPPVLLSDLTRVEMASAIARWARMNEIDEPQAALIENTFEQDAQSGLYLVRPLAPTHYRRAEKWLSARKTGLRTLDALHIACCWGFGAKLVTCDSVMHKAAGMLGLESMLIGGAG
jgi:predicted nucleic acid-binding protein